MLAEVEEQRLWLEVKVFRQYLSLMTHCVPDAREVANLIAINTGRVGVQEGATNANVLGLCIRCFNSYLRTAINAADNRTSYYVMNQYWLMTDALMRGRCRRVGARDRRRTSSTTARWRTSAASRFCWKRRRAT